MVTPFDITAPDASLVQVIDPVEQAGEAGQVETTGLLHVDTTGFVHVEITGLGAALHVFAGHVPALQPPEQVETAGVLDPPEHLVSGQESIHAEQVQASVRHFEQVQEHFPEVQAAEAEDTHISSTTNKIKNSFPSSIE